MLDAGDRACAIEISSHALSLGRADGIHFAAAIFTNLTQDHLDFHATMEDYFQAKRRLFDTDPGVSVVNVGDPYGRRLAAEIDGALTFAVERDAQAGDEQDEAEVQGADYRASDVRCDFDGCHFALHTPAGRARGRAGNGGALQRRERRWGRSPRRTRSGGSSMCWSPRWSGG